MATKAENTALLRSMVDKALQVEGSDAEHPVEALMNDLTSAANIAKSDEVKAVVAEASARGKDAIGVIVVHPSIFFRMGMISANTANNPEEKAAHVVDTLHTLQEGGPKPGKLLWDDVPVIVNEAIDYIGAAVIVLEPEGRKVLDDSMARHAMKDAKKTADFRI